MLFHTFSLLLLFRKVTLINGMRDRDELTGCMNREHLASGNYLTILLPRNFHFFLQWKVVARSEGRLA